MPKDRPVRMVVAALFFVLALFIAMSYLVEGRNLVDWWLPLVLFVIGLAALLLDRGGRAEEEETALAGGAHSYTLREYTFPDRPALTNAEPEQAGEVNVREPRDEVESQEAALPDAFSDQPEVEVEPSTVAPEPVATVETVDAEPEPQPETDEEQASAQAEGDTYAERAMADFETGGEFAPPASAEGALNPPTESDSVEGAVVQHRTPVQREDAARPEMPLEPLEVEKPEQTQAERLEDKGELIQPADTAENEFQEGEHVAFNQPTAMPPTTTVTTGEGFGEGIEPIAPEEKEVLDTTSAPPQPTDTHGVDVTHPEVADAVLSDTESEATTEGIAPSERIRTTPATGSGPDDLTIIHGVGRTMQNALRAAGLDTFTKVAAASDDELRTAIENAGMRLAPTLHTWREQALFLARGDRVGFEALRNALRGETGESTEPDDDQKKTNFTDPGRS